ncbi:MAG: membrane protein insertase YidC, partial [Xanthobacteraceae bacterium]|nr:membrane protein insertase YidC [Xanthobacteraceae bacterium]
MTDNRNTILAVILSGIVLIGWQYFFNIPQMEKQRAAERAAQMQSAQTPAGSPTAQQPQATPAPAGAAP